MKTRIAVVVMTALLLLYIVATFNYAIALIRSGVAVGVIMGIALAVLPVVGVWAVTSELLFGVRSQRLATALGNLGELPVDDLPHRASGRPDRAAADAEFPAYQREVEDNPLDWKAWFRLGLAYDASGDRRRARWATRKAIRLRRAD